MRRVVIRRNGAVVDVSRDGRDPLSMAEYAPLLSQLRYRHVTHLYGRARYDAARGGGGRVEVVEKSLYRFDRRGRLACGAGYIDRINAHYKQAGYLTDYVDITPEREGAFTPHWKRLARYPEFTPTAADKVELTAIMARGEIPPADLARRVKQDEIIRIVAHRISKGLGAGIQAPPGLGKSFTFVAYCLLYKNAKIAVVVPGQDNFYKTHRHLTRYIAGVGMQGCGHTTNRDHPRVTVYTHESAHRIDEDTDILLVDEAHQAMARKAATALGMVAPRAIRIAFSATLEGRGDGTDARMEGLFGPCIYEMGYPEAVAHGMVVPIEVRWISCNFADNPVAGLDDDYRRKKLGIWQHGARNARIAHYARKHPNDQVLIMVATIEHVLCLLPLLPGFSPVYGNQDVDYFTKFRKKGLIDDDFEPVSRESREQMRLDFESGKLRHVVGTRVWGTGVSFDALGVMVRADGMASSIMDTQLPGRVSRVHDASGKDKGILYDCDDLWDRGFRAAADKRRSSYRRNGWTEKAVGRQSLLAP